MFLRIFVKNCNKSPFRIRLYNCALKRGNTKQPQFRKGAEMLKKIMTDIRAAVMLIAVEDLNALRVLLKNITNLASKSVRAYKKT